MQSNGKHEFSSRMIGLMVAAAVILWNAMPRTADADSTLTREEAIEKALSLTGFGPDAHSEEVSLIQAVDTVTPFLAGSINGRRAWRIEFPGIELKNAEADGTTVQLKRTFTIQLDTETGQLLGIRSEYTGPPELTPCEAKWDMATAQLRDMCFESYEGLPDSMPSLTFLDALSVPMCPTPSSAGLIVANYVLYSRGGTPRPAWVVHLHGTPEVRDGITSMRTVIDAKTGEILNAVNLPYSECESPTSVETIVQAQQLVFEYTGFRELIAPDAFATNCHASVITTTESIKHFPRAPLIGQRAWEIRIDSVFLNLPNWHPTWVEKYNPKCFVIQIDSASGHFLSAYTIPTIEEEKLPPLPSRNVARKLMEAWIDLPDSTPPVTLLEALNVALGASPLKAGQTIAHLVLIQQSDGTSLPVWSIIGRGAPLMMSTHSYSGDERLPKNERPCVIESLVNAITGEPMRSHTINEPQE